MTHNLIYEKFMIEYDKANVTSSYPSLTKYEVATILDKAYLALIARKLTGNNTRRVPFEYDVKAIEDLRPLITSKIVNASTATTTASNELAFKLPGDLLYYLEGQASYTNDNSETADNKDHFNEIVNLVDHRTAQRFRATNTNMPWIKQPVSFLQGGDVYVLYDTYKHRDPLSLLVTYLEKPASFVASLVGTESGSGSSGDNPGGNSGNDEPTQPTTQLSISIHRNDFQDDTKALIAATIVVENIEDQLYVDIFEKAETSSLWTLLNTDTYDNNHTISWPVDITTYDKNVKFVIRNSNSTIKKESNIFTISSKPQTEATGNISRIQYNNTDLNIEVFCQLYDTSGVVLKYYIKPISASDQAYVLYGSDEENFTTIISYKEMRKYKNAERGFVYKVELIDKITDSVLDTKTIVVPVESSGDNTDDKVTITFVFQNGDPDVVLRLEENKVFSIPSTIPTKPGYIFKGWHPDDDPYRSFPPGGTLWSGHSDKTYIASWEKGSSEDFVIAVYDGMLGAIEGSERINVYTKHAQPWYYEWKRSDDGGATWYVENTGYLDASPYYAISVYNGSSGWNIEARNFYPDPGKYYVKFVLYDYDKTTVLFQSDKFYVPDLELNNLSTNI